MKFRFFDNRFLLISNYPRYHYFAELLYSTLGVDNTVCCDCKPDFLNKKQPTWTTRTVERQGMSERTTLQNVEIATDYMEETKEMEEEGDEDEAYLIE